MDNDNNPTVGTRALAIRATIGNLLGELTSAPAAGGASAEPMPMSVFRVRKRITDLLAPSAALAA